MLPALNNNELHAAMKQLTGPPYLPFLDNPGIVHMGLSPLSAEHWIEPDSQFLNYYENKQALFATQPEQVYAELPESHAAQKEFAERLSVYLMRYHSGDYFAQTSLQKKNVIQLREHHLTFPVLADEQCLWNAGLWIQDDVCLLQERKGQYVLTAATLCAPSAWDLQEKMARPIFDIHAPVPQLNETIGPQINHVLAKLSPLRPFQRFNWSIKGSAKLALFPENNPPGNDKKKFAEEDLFLRVERQALTRLPKTQAIAFTIRVYLTPLLDLARIPGAIAGLEQAVNSMSAVEVRYKSLAVLYPPLRAIFKSHST